jgi:predicted alpha/beta hydrolase
MSTLSKVRLKKPDEYEYVGVHHARYKGRDFYGEHADDMAELRYLRDWKRWAEQELKSFDAFYRGVNEALNSGDGSYRP